MFTQLRRFLDHRGRDDYRLMACEDARTVDTH